MAGKEARVNFDVLSILGEDPIEEAQAPEAAQAPIEEAPPLLTPTPAQTAPTQTFDPFRGLEDADPGFEDLPEVGGVGLATGEELTQTIEREKQQLMSPEGLFKFIVNPELLQEAPEEVKSEFDQGLKATGMLTKFIRGSLMFGITDEIIETLPPELQEWVKVSEEYTSDEAGTSASALEFLGAVFSPTQMAGAKALQGLKLIRKQQRAAGMLNAMKPAPGMVPMALSGAAAVGFEEDSVQQAALASMLALGIGATLKLGGLGAKGLGIYPTGVQELADDPQLVTRLLLDVQSNPKLMNSFRADPKGFFNKWVQSFDGGIKIQKTLKNVAVKGAEYSNRTATGMVRKLSGSRRALNHWYRHKVISPIMKSNPSVAGGGKLLEEIRTSLMETNPRLFKVVGKGKAQKVIFNPKADLSEVTDSGVLQAYRILEKGIDKKTGLIKMENIIRAKRELSSSANFKDNLTDLGGGSFSRSEGMAAQTWGTVDNFLARSMSGSDEVAAYVNASKRYSNARRSIDNLQSHFKAGDGESIQKIFNDPFEAAVYQEHLKDFMPNPKTGTGAFVGDEAVDLAINRPVIFAEAEMRASKFASEFATMIKKANLNEQGILQFISKVDLDGAYSPVLAKVAAEVPEVASALETLRTIRVAQEYFDTLAMSAGGGGNAALRANVGAGTPKVSMLASFRTPKGSARSQLAEEAISEPNLFGTKLLLADLKRAFKGLEPSVDRNPLIQAALKAVGYTGNPLSRGAMSWLVNKSKEDPAILEKVVQIHKSMIGAIEQENKTSFTPMSPKEFPEASGPPVDQAPNFDPDAPENDFDVGFSQ